MKLIFNDGTSMAVQSVTENDGKMEIKVVLVTVEQLKKKFSDKFATCRIQVEENNRVVKTYDGYTELYRLEEYAGGICGVVMYQEGKDIETRLKELEKANVEFTKQNEMLTQCLLEMSELVYQ